MALPELATTVGSALASAAVASLAYFLAKRRGTDESFKPAKAFATLGAAFFVSLALIAAGEATSQADLAAQLSLFVGPVAVYLQKLIQRYGETVSVQ
ncbi:hypothetical protein [Halococcus saccharolyticus]|uniref:Uncharacterized protein n=1 Tax=Halococcus saccharolyticus DSM 5350 TaxID=1227455 RepID=M0MS93_9EURY|nr:hypothetical protein [Halococcus saccharolyticus]EMA47609.1 hypothetical protein C449_01062 [Halococcus saccharolyticus DSM 5350]